jgi:hypothetical protein
MHRFAHPVQVHRAIVDDAQIVDSVRYINASMVHLMDQLSNQDSRIASDDPAVHIAGKHTATSHSSSEFWWPTSTLTLKKKTKQKKIPRRCSLPPPPRLPAGHLRCWLPPPLRLASPAPTGRASFSHRPAASARASYSRRRWPRPAPSCLRRRPPPAPRATREPLRRSKVGSDEEEPRGFAELHRRRAIEARNTIDSFETEKRWNCRIKWRDLTRQGAPAS